MNNPVIGLKHLKRVKGIHVLSRRYNGPVSKTHIAKLLELVDKHAKEIRELYEKGDQHFLTETGDLAVLCLELLLENGADTDTVLRKCFKRYEDKLTRLLEKK